MLHCVIDEKNKVGLNKLIQMEHKKYSEILANYDFINNKDTINVFEIDSQIPTNLPVIYDSVLEI